MACHANDARVRDIRAKEQRVFLLLCVVIGIAGWLTGRLVKGSGDGPIMHMAMGIGGVLAVAALIGYAGFANRVGIYYGSGLAIATAGAMTFAAAFITDSRRYAWNRAL
jgi:hypothetical protein